MIEQQPERRVPFVEELAEQMDYVFCPSCEAEMEICFVNTASTAIPHTGTKQEMIDEHGEERIILFSFLECPVCQTRLPANSLLNIQ